MKGKIDSNFAIAILALVAACVGFSLYLNAQGVGGQDLSQNRYVTKEVVHEKRTDKEVQVISVSQKLLPLDEVGTPLEKVSGEIISIGECPPCNHTDGVVCTQCAEVTVMIQDESTGDTVGIPIFISTADELSVGQYVQIIADMTN